MCDTTINPYRPDLATVKEIIEETHNIKTFRIVLNDAEKMKNFTFESGQVGQLSIFGVGESTFVINSPPSEKDYLQFSVMRTGEVTQRLHQLNDGLDLQYSMTEVGSHFGLRNIHERLMNLYGEQYGLTFQSSLGVGTTITITIPLRGD